MPEYLAPGLYVEEIDSGSKPIEGVGTNTAAFIGYAKSGEFNSPTFISSWTEFQRLYGEDDAIIYPALSKELGHSVYELVEAKRMSKQTLLDFARQSIVSAGKKWSEFAETYNVPLSPISFTDDGYMAYAVQGFYLNGGSRAYIVRVARPSDLEIYKGSATKALTSPVPASVEMGGFTVKALKGGTAGNSITVKVEHVEGQVDSFTIKVSDGEKEESFGTAQKPLTPDSFSDTVSKGANKSKIIEVTTAVAEKSRPVADVFKLKDGADATDSKFPSLPLQDKIGKVKPEEFVGDEARRSGVRGLAEIDDINMICAPDLMAGLYQRANLNGSGLGPERCVLDDERKQSIIDMQAMMIAYAERAGDRMVILDSLPDYSPQEIRDTVLNAPFSSDHGQAAYYYPWVKVIDEVNKKPGKTMQKLVPPCGHVAGVYAKVVNERGVHKAPANVGLAGVVDLERQVTKGEQEILNPEGINCIRSFPGTGIRIWGARTLATRGNPSWKYVNVRRLFNYLEKSIDRNLQWTVFEPNDPDLWGRVRRTISAFLFTEWKEGKLFGTLPEEAYYVKCDRETNPQEMIDLGRMYCEVGVNPVKPAEFVIIRIGQWAGGSETSEN